MIMEEFDSYPRHWQVYNFFKINGFYGIFVILPDIQEYSFANFYGFEGIFRPDMFNPLNMKLLKVWSV